MISENFVKDLCNDFRKYDIKTMIDDHEYVEFVFLSGSHLLGIVDNHSDIDVSVIYKKGYNIKNHKHGREYIRSTQIEYKGIGIDMYHNPVEYFDVRNEYNNQILNIVGLMQLCFITEEYILYDNDFFKTLDTVSISINAANELLTRMYKTIKDVVESNDIHTKPMKMLYHSIIAKHIIDQDFDMDVEKLKLIKRVAYVKLDDITHDYALGKLREIVEYMERGVFKK